ncbi:(2E,6E)-farnesyl diphosphate synthase [Muribacter muris]|uniref:(2E,6E)-farnesyl diphosphate synthase n=1 Tax=Muribacter muris TaxID=67855 RepID=A0A4Y9K3D2_9PAST|nr:(2E,6E)-farnesyl diphosphate synthase [Muribacter muris]MBF0784540.1 (2E,6E)-farnesyl diphosphate synthase [Muribacter muris]MBF0826164.1 (2E,6E)-farnesyl diphosphate synthase [Muribacter muris]TFV12052.1 (2E,6E)-farnesyl diphosphate synthase [Muribacter muris]
MQHDFSARLQQSQERINTFLAQQLADYAACDTPLIEAMSYAVLLGGKRIRPFLIYTVGQMLGVPLTKLDRSAAAMEAIHAYSLVHDDLPAMDNDMLRRGQPTCHIAFDEATAILAGDALQTFAFELVANDSQLTAEQKIAQIQWLAASAGAKGMCLGQSLDLQSENKAISLAALEQIHRHKTGALIEAAVMLGFNLSDYAQNSRIKQSLLHYAQSIGLAFQVQDDILDIVGESEKIGKTVGADEALNKSTYPKLLGLSGAKAKADGLYQSALAALNELPFDTSVLAALAHFIISRES